MSPKEMASEQQRRRTQADLLFIIVWFLMIVSLCLLFDVLCFLLITTLFFETLSSLTAHILTTLLSLLSPSFSF